MCIIYLQFNDSSSYHKSDLILIFLQTVLIYFQSNCKKEVEIWELAGFKLTTLKVVDM